MKKLTTELAAQITERLFASEVRDVIEATEKAAGDTGTFEVVITTENVDRYQEVIKLDGWELEHYLKNPVVLWGHDHFTLPIGMCTSIEVSGGKMIAKGKFAPHAHAQEIRALYDLGIVRATSVGFIEKEREGNLITKSELIEFSFVSVPANPYALSLALEKELNINELVTKGFMTIVKEAEPVEEEVPEPEPEVPPVEVPAEEKTFSTKAITPIIDQLKSVLSALEALETEEPERTEEEPAAETEEEKAYKQFNADRRAIQNVATALGDVLAVARQAVEARR